LIDNFTFNLNQVWLMICLLFSKAAYILGMFLLTSSTLVVSCMLYRILIISPLWGKSLYKWYPSHPQHLIALSLFHKDYTILDPLWYGWLCWYVLGLLLRKGGLNLFFLWFSFSFFLSFQYIESCYVALLWSYMYLAFLMISSRVLGSSNWILSL